MSDKVNEANLETTVSSEVEINENQEKTVSKALFDKQAKQLSEMKKQLKSYMSADEQAKIEMQERDNEISELRAFKRASELSSGLVQHLGAEHSKSVSEAIIGGDTSSIVKAIEKAFTGLIKAKDDEIANLKLEAMNQGTNGSNNSTNKTITVEDFKAMGIDQRIALKNENPQLYDKLRRG